MDGLDRTFDYHFNGTYAHPWRTWSIHVKNGELENVRFFSHKPVRCDKLYLLCGTPWSLIDSQNLGDQCLLGHFQPQQQAENWLANDRISCKTVGAVDMVYSAGSFSKTEHWKVKDIRNSPHQNKRICIYIYIYVILAGGLWVSATEWGSGLCSSRIPQHHGTLQSSMGPPSRGVYLKLFQIAGFKRLITSQNNPNGQFWFPSCHERIKIPFDQLGKMFHVSKSCSKAKLPFLLNGAWPLGSSAGIWSW